MNEEYYGYCAKQHKTKELLRDYIQYDKMDDFSNLNGLIDNLLLCAMFHKHESFSSEQEIRISPLFVNEMISIFNVKYLILLGRYIF